MGTGLLPGTKIMVIAPAGRRAQAKELAVLVLLYLLQTNFILSPW
jgi:hypothetical protein